MGRVRQVASGNLPILAVGTDIWAKISANLPGVSAVEGRTRCLRPLRQRCCTHCESANQWRALPCTAPRFSWSFHLPTKMASMITATPDNPTTQNSTPRASLANPSVGPIRCPDGRSRPSSRQRHFDASQCPAMIALLASSFALDTCVSQDHHRVPDPGRLYCRTGLPPQTASLAQFRTHFAKTLHPPAADLGCHSKCVADRHV